MNMNLNKKDGFSLIEALMGLFIMGFGMIAIAKFQSTLFENSDLAKQRTEATRLAQDRIEQFRTFQQLTAANGVDAYADLTSNTGGETISGTSNTTYTRKWEVTTSTTPSYQLLKVTVEWKDRKNETKTIELDSIIAGLDPSASGSLIVPPAGSPVKNPMNRSINIPFPANSVPGTGKSTFTPPGASGFYFVFNDATGVITAKCAGVESGYSSVTCPDTLNGYVVSGYVLFSTGNTANFTNPSDARWDLTMTMGITLGSSFECYDDGGTSATYANTVTYTCVVYPVDHDGDASTAMRWSGTLEIVNPMAGGVIGTGGSNFKICRYTFDYDGDGTIENIEHAAQYSNVTGSIQNQNFVVIKGNNTCLADNTVPSSTTANYNVVQHQP